MRSLTLASSLLGILALGACASGGTPSQKCGNHVCDLGEDQSTCPTDCIAAVCGDHVCEANESVVSCLTDCYCGNGSCDVGETLAACPQDCSSAAVCGNGSCEAGETVTSCPQDCTAGPVCPNGICETGETVASCPQDCTAGPVCPNGVCETGETVTSCPQDCDSGCEDVTCDMVPACGCGAGDKCTILSGTTHECVDAGSASAGDACSAETDCAAGLICIGDGAGHSMCMAWCETTSDCPGGAGAMCLYTLNDGNGGTVPGVMLCSVDCNPVTPSTSCPAGWNCDLYVDDSDNLLSDCTYTGSTNTSGTCSTSADCAPGYLCDTTYGTCAQYCRVGTSDCGSLTCYTFGVSLGSVEYGVCDF